MKRKHIKQICKITAVILAILLALVTVLPTVAKDRDTYISKIAQNACVEYGTAYGICPELLMAMIEAESSGDPDAENGTCKGLMQVSIKWHTDRMERLGVTDIYDEAGNILVGTDYLSELLRKHNDVGIALMYYNGDSNAPKAAKDECELSKYAHKVLNRAEELEKLHNK